MILNESLAITSFVTFIKASKLITDKLKENISTYSLNTSEFAVLDLLYHKGKQTIHQICQNVLMASGSMTYIIDKLEKKELVKREHCPEDRRATYIMITHKGSQFMNDTFPKYQKVIEDLFGALDEEEKKAIIRIVGKIGYNRL
ncbi:MarR family winged helix-turn-helix transcriptional regulator [Priestia megaterium]|uniref:MarR family winged helix-turn-helix transcriptional regulator n=1 Tax=Priestia megaterium TaxID=1404 RepID=UPI00211D65FA|nr:MarR family transcriptional regulator [Priestia megaterium]